MRISNDELKLLSLNKNEIRLLKALEGRQGVSLQELSERLSVPRTSVYWPLSQLQKRNLVGYEMVGKRKRWYSRVGESALRRKLGALESVAGDVRVVEGVENIQELYRLALDLHPAERILILEGNVSVRSIAREAGTSFMAEWHGRALEKQIIIESIIGETVYAQLLKRAINPIVVRSLARLERWIAHIVPDVWIHTDASLVIFRDSAILADWSRAHAVFINTPEVVALMRGLCEGMRFAGRKVDIVSDVRAAAKDS